MLHRYWIVIFPEDPYGPRNLGVTAFSIEQAKALVKVELKKLGWNHISEELIEESEIIEDIDIRLLDQNHVIPNMGVVTFKGVWFPSANC